MIKPSTALPWVVNTQTWKSKTSDHQWSACGIEQDESVYGVMASAVCYAQTTGQLSPKDAVYIVQAVNSHAALVEALQDIVARNEIQSWFNLDKARAALKLAGANDE